MFFTPPATFYFAAVTSQFPLGDQWSSTYLSHLVCGGSGAQRLNQTTLIRLSVRMVRIRRDQSVKLGGDVLGTGISDPEGSEFDPLIKLCPPYSQIQIRPASLGFIINDDLTDEMSKLSPALPLCLSTFCAVEIFRSLFKAVGQTEVRVGNLSWLVHILYLPDPTPH